MWNFRRKKKNGKESESESDFDGNNNNSNDNKFYKVLFLTQRHLLSKRKKKRKEGSGKSNMDRYLWVFVCLYFKEDLGTGVLGLGRGG